MQHTNGKMIYIMNDEAAELKITERNQSVMRHEIKPGEPNESRV